MDASFARSLRAAWLARWQEIAPRLTFWLLLAGYDLRDRSRRDLLYVPYLVAFWMVWLFAMFTALSGVLANLLPILNPIAPALGLVSVTLWALLLWALVSLYQATRRSPLIFSPADASLLCQTPVDRRALTTVWFLTDWPARVVPFAAWALLSGFALFEAQIPIETVDLLIVLQYWAYGLRALSVILPLHMMLLALAWAAGVWRLHGRHGNRLVRWSPVIVLLLLIPLPPSLWQHSPFHIPDRATWQALAMPLLSGFGAASWAQGLLFALVGVGAAFAGLFIAARQLNLSRAAQETSYIYSERYLAQVGAREAARHLKRQRRLGAGTRHATRSVAPGIRASVGKDIVRSARTWREALWPWLGVFALSVGVVAAPDWGSRLVALVFWVRAVANRSTSLLSDNLAHWWLWRQQPFSNRRLVGASMASPTMLLIILSLAASLISSRLPWSPDFTITPLAPLLSMTVALTAAWNLLRSARPHRLLTGEAPGLTVLGWFLSLLLAASSLGVAWLAVRVTGLRWLGIAAGALVSFLIMALLISQINNRTRRFV